MFIATNTRPKISLRRSETPPAEPSPGKQKPLRSYGASEYRKDRQAINISPSGAKQQTMFCCTSKLEFANGKWKMIRSSVL